MVWNLERLDFGPFFSILSFSGNSSISLRNLEHLKKKKMVPSRALGQELGHACTYWLAEVCGALGSPFSILSTCPFSCYFS